MSFNFVDQILFWDTSFQGIVNLSSSKKAFNKKVIANHFLGGHLVIRPAELFEGEDFYFDSAVKEGGILFELMNCGMASLALDAEKSIEDRANWRFNKEVVFDRGKEVRSAKDIEEVKRRTFDRAEKMEKSGWKNAPIQNATADSTRNQRLNERFRASIWTISREYLSENEIAENSIGAFLATKINVASRSDLYPKIDQDWSLLIPENFRKAFIVQLKEALTLATNLTTAETFGGKVSDIRNDTIAHFMAKSKNQNNSYQYFELEAVKLFVEALKKELGEKELLNNPLIKSINTMDTKKLVENSVKSISGEDRLLLHKLIYEKSKYLEGMSFIELLVNCSEKLTKSQKISKLRGRIQELQSDSNRNANVIAIIRAAVLATGAEAALVMLMGSAPNFLVTAGVLAVDLGIHFSSTDTPVFAGFRRSIESSI
ncbi:hypothetical protein L3V43_06975 [Pseudoalteromonas sp. L23]|uniref:hypothetical protein n=1 Tax=unclassified Pseudoalteromonas TaxID=194690 RepID=UPI001EF1366A|nr:MULTISPECIES: hypothetical protein [unclassified Pseudoalteromonas]MCF7513633.1 hypothetical protein [Pseudoalteromonas sp. L7]MCF7525390.1 hypothetical protein [Pseudoalteromonas sp. L23]MCX2766097.1 hypothetical protein [Pseudoalteromonas sp. B530]